VTADTPAPYQPAPYQPAPYQPAPYPYPPGGFPPGHPLAPAVAPNGLRLAEFGDRLLAYLIDSAILAGISMVIFVPIIIAFVAYMTSTSTLYTDASPTMDPTVLVGLLCLEGVFFLVQLALMYAYFVTYQGRKGQTVGKRTMKIKILPLDPAAALTHRMLQRRFLAGPVASLIPGYGWLDGLWQLWDKPFRQCLHDKFAATVVVKLPDMVRVAG
jgi:uncharacterized RDD family membrane protein YckC